jgi:hypothetical protein
MPGNGRYFFTEKSTQKLSTTPFATKGLLLFTSSISQSSDVEKEVNFRLCFGWIG